MLQIKLMTGCRVLAVKITFNVFSLRRSQREDLILLLLLSATTSSIWIRCLCYDSRTCKTSQGTMSDSTAQPCSQAAKSGKFTSLSRATKHSYIHFQLKQAPHLEVIFLTESFILNISSSCHRTFGIFQFCKIYEDAKLKSQSSTRCSLTLATNFNLILTFITRTLIGSCVDSCTFSLASSKYDCP